MERKQRRNKNTEKKQTELRDFSAKTIRQSIINYIVIILFLVATIAIELSIIKINMLPLKYLIPVIIVIVLIFGLISFFILRRKTGKKVKIVLYVLSLILSIGYFLGSSYCSKMNNFLEEIETEHVDLKTYYVIGLKGSQYEKVEDLEKADVGYYHNELVDSSPVLNKFQEKVSSANLMAYTNIDELGEALENNEVAAILVEDSYKLMLEEADETFIEKENVIFTFEIEAAIASISKEVASITKEPFSIYVSGIDTYGKIASVSRSDVNMVITVNPETHTVLLTSIPRDYYVKLNGTTGYKDKLTHAGIYGVEKSVKTVEDLLDVDINYYFRVNFTSLVDIINALGGVTVYSDQAFTTTFGKKRYSYVEGENELNGKEALAFARERKAFKAGDRMRGVHQQAVLQGIIDKASSYTIVSKFDSILNSLKDKFTTNMGYEKMQELVKYQLDKMPTWEVVTCNLDGYDSRQRTYSAGRNKLYVMVPLENSVRDARNLIQAVIKGEATDGTYVDPNVKVPSSITSLPTYTDEEKKEPNKEETKPIVKPVEPEVDNVVVPEVPNTPTVPDAETPKEPEVQEPPQDSTVVPEVTPEAKPEEKPEVEAPNEPEVETPEVPEVPTTPATN